MRTLFCVTATLLVLLSSTTASADPFGAMTGSASLVGSLASPAKAADCEQLRRNTELRMRLRPSERRERIRQCEFASLEIKLADNASGAIQTAKFPTAD